MKKIVFVFRPPFLIELICTTAYSQRRVMNCQNYCSKNEIFPHLKTLFISHSKTSSQIEMMPKIFCLVGKSKKEGENKEGE
jgi:hypothetical protein